MNRIRRGEIKPNKKFTEHGTIEKANYIIEIDKNTGHKIIKESGITNTYEKIQARADEVDINKIIERATRGDYSGFKDQASAIYGDFTGIPDNMIEMANLKLKSDKAWENLPLEIRREYDHDKDKYFRDIGSEKWMKLHGFGKKEEERKEIKTDEQGTDE